jgi:hypothetical protein
MAALCLAHLATAGRVTFTPTIDPIPDVVIGDQTPVTGLTPEEIASPEHTLENQNPGVNIFDFPDALDLFALVQGGTGAAQVSDEDLIYEFFASPVLPAADTDGVANERISINGQIVPSTSLGDLSSAVDATGGLLTFKDEAFSVDADASPVSSQGPLTYAFGPEAHPHYAGPFRGPVTAPLIDENMLTLVVTNTGLPLGSNQASAEFAVFTVDDGPDAVSGSVLLDQTVVDLGAWAFDVKLNHGIGNLILPETGLVTAQIPDDDNPPTGDGSGSDLQTGTASIEGNSFAHWGSPPDLIPFVDGGTYRTLWTVSSSGFAGAVINTPPQRFRALYGFFGGLGVNDLHVEGFVAPPPVGGSLEYRHLFDHFDGIASASGTTLGIGDYSGVISTENSFRLLWDWVDLAHGSSDNDGGGTLELDSVVIQRLDRTALLGQMSTILDVDDFRQGVLVDATPTFNGSAASMVFTFPTVVGTPWTVTSTGSAHFNGAFTFGGSGGIPIGVDYEGVGTLPSLGTLPLNPDTRICRGQATVTPFQEDVPVIRVNVKSFETSGTRPSARLTAETIINAQRSLGSGLGDSPALTAGLPSDFSSYLELPRGLSFGSGPGVGDVVQVSVDVIDTDNPYLSGGATPVTLQVNRLLLEAGPPDLLP